MDDNWEKDRFEKYRVKARELEEQHLRDFLPLYRSLIKTMTIVLMVALLFLPASLLLPPLSDFEWAVAPVAWSALSVGFVLATTSVILLWSKTSPRTVMRAVAIMKWYMNVTWPTVIVAWFAALIVALPRVKRHILMLAEVPAAVAALVVLAVGVVLFVFRLKARATYGLSEIVVGLLIAVDRFPIKGVHAPASEWTVGLALSLSAGVYLVVRGLDNGHQGLGTDPIVRFMKTRYSSATTDLDSNDPPTT